MGEPRQNNGSIAAKIERELVQKALAKRRAGENPTTRETAALRRWEAARREDQAWEIYRDIPQKHWIKMSGRQWKVLREQAELYGIPFAEDRIDLPKVVRALHDFFAKHFRKFSQVRLDPEGELLQGCSQKIKDEYVKEQTRRVRLQADEMEGKLVRMDELVPLITQLSTSIRRTGEQLQRRFGHEALDIFESGLVEFDQASQRIMDAGRNGT